MPTFQTTRPSLYPPPRQSEPPPPTGVGRFAREISLICGLGAWGWWVLCLWTYSREDAAWTTSGENLVRQNLCGTTGAWVADVSFFLFGFSVWWVLLALFWLGWMLFITRAMPPIAEAMESEISDTARFRFHSLAFIGGLLLLLSASTTLEWSWLSRMEGRLPNYSGGILGYSIGSWIIKILGFSELGLISIILTLLGMALVFHFSWLQLSEWLGASLEHSLQTIWQQLEQIRDRKLGQRAMRERESSMYEERVAMHMLAPTGAEVSENSSLNSSLNLSRDSAMDSSFGSVIDEEYPTWEEAEAAAAAKIAAAQQAEYEAHHAAEPEVSNYQKPPLTLLTPLENSTAGATNGVVDTDTLAATARLIEKRLGDLGIQAIVRNPQIGPIITCYDVEREDQAAQASNLSDMTRDLARSLSVPSLRIVEKNLSHNVTLELPNAKRQTIRLINVLETAVWQESESPLIIALGVDTLGNPVVLDLAKMPHVLIAGAEGSGKSVGIHSLICSLLFRAEARDVRLLLIDPKMRKFPIYEGIPHLIAPIVSDVHQAINGLAWCVAEMDYRYQLMRKLGVASLDEFNQRISQAKRRGELFYCPENPRHPRKPMEHLPYVVAVIHELADLMVGHSKKVQTLIACLAQKARATGIHLVISTKNPHDNVVTELIRANIPARMTFQVNSRMDSLVMLDTHGAETLLGMGDMLYRAGSQDTLLRVHGAFIHANEIQAIVKHICEQCPEPNYLPDVLETPVTPTIAKIGTGEDDPIYEQVMVFLLDKHITSAPELERRFKITHQRAIELLAQMEKTGIVSTMGHAGKRDVLTQNFSLVDNKKSL